MDRTETARRAQLSMLSQGDIDALLAARHADPFGVLGLHADADGKL